MKIYRPKRLTYVCTILFLLFFSVAALAQRPFITKWKINGSGEKITIPINSEVTGYNYNVDWGDGTSTTGHTATAEHYYFNAGTYTVSISGNFPALKLGSLSDPDFDYNAWKLIAIEQWGDVVWKSMEGAFFGAQDLLLNASDIPNLSNVTSLDEMFRSAVNFMGSAQMKDWDVSNITSMRNMFLATKFDQDIGDWDVSQVKNMGGLFTATPFNQDISGWDVSRVEDMNNMFVNNHFFNQDISGWDVGQVKNMGSLFRNATAFNRDISSWDVSNVTDMQSMLYGATSFNRSLGNWNIKHVTILSDIFVNSGISKTNYDATLIGWAAQANLSENVILRSTGLTFCASADARQYLIDEYHWDITGDSPGCQSMLIFVKKEDGKTLNVLAEGSDAIQQLKQKIEDKSGITVGGQQLFFNNVELEDGRTLADYGIGNGNTIELILSTNRAPIAVDDQVSVTEDIPATGNVLTNDSDPEGNALTASLVTAPVNGTVVLNADGSFTYTPNSNYSGLDSLRYQVCDNGTPSLCDTAWVHFTVAAVNDAPILAGLPLEVTVREDATEDPFDISSATILDTDAGSGELTLTLEASGGIFDIAAGTGITVTGHLTPRLTLKGNLTNLNHYIHSPSNIYFRPDHNLNGNNAASVKVFINDNGNTGIGGGTDVFIATVKINITPVNDAPVAVDDPVNVTENMPTTGNVLTNDSDPEGNALTASLVTAPVNGTIVLNADGSFTYTPNSNYSGLDSLRYQVCDNGTPSLCDTAWVHFTVLEVNKAPTDIQLSNIAVVQSAGMNGVVGSLSTADPDIQDTHTYTLVAGGVDNSKFNIFNNNGNWVLRTNNPGIMSPQAYAIRIRTTDNNNKIFEKAFTITVVDDIAPVVTSVAVPANGYYREGDPLEFAVNFSENVIVSGTPYIPITIGSTVKIAQYSTGLGTNQLVFSYTVQAGEVDMDGVTLGTAIHLNGGTIRDAGQNNAVLTLQSIAPTNNVLVNAVRPTVVLSTAMTLVNTPFSVTATFSEAVTGFSVADITASNTTISNLQTANNITYSFLVTPTAGGLVQLSLPEHVAVNIAGNGNTASNILNVQYNKVISGISFENGTFVYDGAVKSLAITGTLPSGTTVSYQNNSRTDVGTQEVTATVSGANYEDLVLKADLTINKAVITGITLSDNSFVYNGMAQSLAITGTLPTGTTVSYQNNSRTDVGVQEVTATISGSNYEDLVLKADLTINKAAITGITLSDGTFVYDGTVKSLAIIGTLPTGTTVSYQNNSRTDVGTQEVTATVSGANYEDLVLKANLTINKAEISGIALSDDSFVYNGTARSLAITGTLPTGTTVSYQNNSRTDVGTQEVTATISGANYEDLVLKADLTINKAMITGITLSDGSFVYDGTVRSLAITGTLPQGVSVTYTNNGKTDAGTYTVTANIDGGINYNSMVRTATLIIRKATLNHLTLSDAQYVYDGTVKSLRVAGAVPSGLEILYVNNAKINAGIYEVTAVIEPSTNYEGISLAATLQIKKAAQVITFNSPGILGRDAGTVPLDVSASSNLPIRLTIDEPLIATVSGTDLQVHRLGTVTVTAIQEGDANHEAAEAVSLKIRIAAAADAKLPVRVHQAVSPNGDGINEFLMIEGIGDYLDNKVTIFDKSGRVLQEIEGYNNRDQVFTGEYHRDGTYYYYLDVKDDTQWKREKGFFVIRR